jgi:hypothetical protein
MDRDNISMKWKTLGNFIMNFTLIIFQYVTHYWHCSEIEWYDYQFKML